MKIYNESSISDYLKGFSNLFICHKTNNIIKCEQFISGLLHECKSNIERMVERVPASYYDQLHHFISKSPWNSLAVMDSGAAKVHNTLQLPPRTDGIAVVIGLVLDESGWEKSGKRASALCVNTLDKLAFLRRCLMANKWDWFKDACICPRMG